jgi:hypothetical protein
VKKILIFSNKRNPKGNCKCKFNHKVSFMKYMKKVFFIIVCMSSVTAFAQTNTTKKAPVIDAKAYLSQKLYSRTEVDNFLAGCGSQFARFDSEVGWLLRDASWEGSVNNMLKSAGVNGATWSTSFDHDKCDQRHMIAYSNQPCRINTYGDSFTHCDQVNDGETWQEVLANHLREPIRNFGVGGYSVYQAYLRMLREETHTPSELIIFNIYEDDHYRNIGAWGTIRTGKDWRFFWPPVPYVTVNFSTGQGVGLKNPCLNEEMFYHLCDLDWVEKRFKDDFTLGIMLAEANSRAGNEDQAWKILEKTAKQYGLNERISHTGSPLDIAERLHSRAALLATMQIVEWIEEFAKQNNKKVLYVLSYSACHQGQRFDQTFVDFLACKGVQYVDLLALHRAEFSKFNISIDEYNQRYWNGHYNPSGNFFTALAIRDRIISMLNPKSPSYQPLYVK